MTCGITVPWPRQWKPRIVTTRPPGNGLFIAFQFLGPHPLGFTNAHMMLSSWLPTNHLLSIKSNSTLFLTLQKEQHQTGLKILFYSHLGAWDTSFFWASSWFPSPAPSSPLPIANRVGGPRHPPFLITPQVVKVTAILMISVTCWMLLSPISKSLCKGLWGPDLPSECFWLECPTGDRHSDSQFFVLRLLTLAFCLCDWN